MNEYCEYILEKLEEFGRIEFKRMFGGIAVYCNKSIIGIIEENEIYLKCNKENSSLYTDFDCDQFSYERKKDGKRIKMCYWRLNDEILEDKDILGVRVRQALIDSKSND